jgi:hypothetical protein
MRSLELRSRSRPTKACLAMAQTRLILSTSPVRLEESVGRSQGYLSHHLQN